MQYFCQNAVLKKFNLSTQFSLYLEKHAVVKLSTVIPVGFSKMKPVCDGSLGTTQNPPNRNDSWEQFGKFSPKTATRRVL